MSAASYRPLTIGLLADYEAGDIDQWQLQSQLTGIPVERLKGLTAEAYNKVKRGIYSAAVSQSPGDYQLPETVTLHLPDLSKHVIALPTYFNVAQDFSYGFYYDAGEAIAKMYKERPASEVATEQEAQPSDAAQKSKTVFNPSSVDFIAFLRPCLHQLITGCRYTEDRKEIKEVFDLVCHIEATEAINLAVYLIAKIDEAKEYERGKVGGKTKEIEERAGINNFAPFGKLNVIASLTARDFTKGNFYMSLSAAQVIDIRAQAKVEGEYNAKYAELQNGNH